MSALSESVARIEPQSDELFRRVVEAAPNAMVLVADNGLIRFVNAQAEKLFGYRRDAMIGSPVEMLVPPRHRPEHGGLRGAYFRHPDTRAMGRGRELYGLTRDGREVPIEIGLNPIELAHGHAVLASIIDITERKRAQDALRNSDLRFRQMVSGLRDYAILMLDVDGRVASWNEGAERLKGYAEDEIVGRSFSIFHPAEDVAAGKPQRELQIAREQGRFEDEGWRVRKGGARFWANVILTAMRDERGELIGFSKLTRDMTERRRSDERFRLVVEAAPNAMLMIGRDGIITLVNRQTEKLFGYCREQLLGKKIEILVPPRIRDAHPRQRDGYFGCPSTRAMGVGRDLHGVTQAGVEIPIEIGLNPIETDEGLFILASIIDITERKRAEVALRAANQSLEVQVEETRKALARLRDTQDQLIQSEKLASLGGLVAGVAHEINTPVGIGVTAASHLHEEVSSFSSQAANGGVSRARFAQFIELCRQSSDIILSNLRRAAELIQSFKQVAVDQTNSDWRTVDLHNYLQEVLLSLRPRLKKTALNIEIDCPPALCVPTVPGALAQVITNLVMNSITHAYEPGQAGTIRIAAAVDGERLGLRYSDDGRGIPGHILPKIFDPFFTTKRGAGGSGLGLHIVYNLVHSTLGGKLDVESVVSRGTTFLFDLPTHPPAGAVSASVTP